MQNRFNYKTALILSYLTIGSFILCYLIIGYYNRHSADDFDGIAAVNKNGIVKSWTHQYFNWAGPFSAGLLYYVVSDLFQDFTSLFWYNAITLAVLLFNFTLMSYRIGKSLLGLSGKEFAGLNISFMAALFFASPRISEIWFWFCGSVEYIWPLSFLFLGVFFLLDEEKSKLSLIWSSFFFFLLGGGAINYPWLTGVMYFVFLLYRYKEDRKINLRLLTPFLFLIVGTIVHVIAPGNYVRRGYVEHIISYDIGTIIKQIGKGSLRIVIYNVIFQLPYVIVILSPVLVCGFVFSDKLTYRFEKLRLKKIIISLLLLYVLAMIMHCLLLYLAVGNSGGPGRTRLLLHLIFCLSVAVVMFLIGAKYKGLVQKYSFLTYALLTMSFGLFVYKLIHEVSIVSEYTKAYDERTRLITDALNNYEKNKIETLYLPKLPPSGGRTYDDPYFSDFIHKIGPINYFLSVPNGALEGSEIGKRRDKKFDTIVDVFREDQINIRIEKKFKTPFRLDLDTIPR